MRTWSFAKGHGTRNDFVIIVDRHGLVPVTDQDVRDLCDRRAGIGADGLLRVTLASTIPEWEGDSDLWFMDYRNQDGSIAEMCGNGLRVFVRYLLDEDLVSGERIDVATRAGLRHAFPRPDGRIRTWMGPVALDRPGVVVETGQGRWEATRVDVGNPHAVVLLPGGDAELADIDLRTSPTWEPAAAYPEGTNIEFVQVVDDDHISMRVFERGAGETMSCGTGTVAAAAAHLKAQGRATGTVTVDVPGGRLEVEIAEGEEAKEAWLTGPAVIVGRGKVTLDDEF